PEEPDSEQAGQGAAAKKLTQKGTRQAEIELVPSRFEDRNESRVENTLALPGSSPARPCGDLNHTSRAAMSSRLLALVLIAASALPGLVEATENSGPRIETNQSYLEEVMRPPRLDLNEPKSVFSHVLRSLPPRVKVYPTENYYYFKFTHNHVRYAGNFRLDINERDRGQIGRASSREREWNEGSTRSVK